MASQTDSPAAEGMRALSDARCDANGVRSELLDASDEVIEDAVQYADMMVLRGLLYQLTDDGEVAATNVATVSTVAGAERSAPATEADVATLRRKAVEFLKAYRDSGASPIEIGPTERLQKSLGLALGDELADEEVEYWVEELALDPWTRSLRWMEPPTEERLERFSVTIIGAGMGGLNAALQLKRAGIPFTMIEKNSDVGGTWFENRYPGCRLDTPSRGFTHIFGVDFGYPYPFLPHSENERYVRSIADTFALRDDIVFNSEVCSLSWDENRALWEIEIAGPEGTYTLYSNAVITAVGLLNRPNIPVIEGQAEFKGSSWHTAQWPVDADMEGLRVAVIGSGSSGYQMIPELALLAEHVVVFQRTPQWLVEVAGYRSPFPQQVNWLDRNLPYYTNFLRFRTLALTRALAALTEIDPEFEDPHALNESNRRMRDACIGFLERKLGDPELVAMMTPPHPFLSARPVNVDPEYSVLDALLRDDVTFVTDSIESINETGVRTKDGTQHDVDVIVYATGFRTEEYLFPMTVTGRGGKKIEELWGGSARAYASCMYPGFPNLWSLYGPNSTGGVSVVSFGELVTVNALECIERLVLENKRAIEVKEEAYRSFNKLLDERNSSKIWSDPRAHYYWWSAEHGRTAIMCPLRPVEVWQFLRHPNFDDLDIE